MSGLLKHIDGPADLKKLSVAELKELAEEIRFFIISSVSKTGGHLASSLGTVDMTLALHYVFDFKTDKLVWDVGHQCYAHKIITGRKGQFGKLRHAGGLSGFPNPAESEYDPFMVGHAGTSVATALGLALGAQQQQKDDKVVAIVGDASIVNGLSFEALNNLELVNRQLLIILNDNSMAIDVTQGALAKYFSKIRLSQTYEDLRKTTNNILEHLPTIGKGVEGIIERIKKSIRMTLPASQMFESLNIPYFGPVDGHDISALVKLFRALEHQDHPVMLHVYTKKGKGFTPAEKNRPKYHSTGPFELSGEAVEPELAAGRTFTDAFGDSLVEIAKKDEKIVAITSAMCDGTGLAKFRDEFEDRFYDVGIAESVAVDIAAGMAKTGLKPVVCIYSTFLQRSFDQIFQEVALQNLPVIFCIDRAGLVGADGPTHHGLLDIGFLRMIPNMVLVAPSDENEMQLSLEFAFESGKAVVVRYPKELLPDDKFSRSACSKPFKLGKSVVVKRNAKANFVIVSYGSVLTEALKAAETLGKEGIDVEVINARFAVPIDKKIIDLLEQGKSIITVEDGARDGGFGSAVLESASLAGVSSEAIVTLAVPREFIKHDSRSAQLKQVGISADKITEAVKKLAANKK